MVSKKFVSIFILYLLLGIGFGLWMAKDFAREDLAIGKICQTYQSCFSDQSLIILLITLVWPLGVFMSLLNLDPFGLIFLSGVILLLLAIRYFPGSKPIVKH